MFSKAEKIAHHSLVQQQSVANPTSILQRKGEDAFFSDKQNNFFESKPTQAFIQPKLTVSSPDDPQEKEADAMAEKVMRMPEPVSAIQETGQDIQAKEEEEEVKAKTEDSGLHSVQLKSEEEQEIQAKLQPQIQRKEQEVSEEKTKEPLRIQFKNLLIDRKIQSYGNVTIQRQGRAPPGQTRSFEQGLSGSKGAGSPLSESTRTFMETRFNADFSGVRVHTDSTAIQLSRDIHAQAFTHGNDIYFNAGKFSPHSADGKSLLAHELTHTIQQGASKTVNVAAKSQAGNIGAVNRKPMLYRKAAAPDRPRVSNLDSAVKIAQGEAGKVDAGKAGADGYRIGWNRLTEYFETSMGADKVLPEGAPFKPGTVSIGDIKKKRMVSGMKPNQNDPSVRENRDAMPSWCGIFVFWALNKSGIPMKPWVLGRQAVNHEAAYLPGYAPRPGDIAYRNKFSHFAMVVKSEGSDVVTINGNTAGNDNLGGQVQERTDPLKNWTAFFDPLYGVDSNKINAPAFVAPERNLTFLELRKEIFLNRKAEETEESEHAGAETEPQEQVDRKSELSDWNVNNKGQLQRSAEIEQVDKSQETEKEQGDKEEGHIVSAKFEIQRQVSRSFMAQSENVNYQETESSAARSNSIIHKKTSDSGVGNIDTGELQTASRGPPGINGIHISQNGQANFIQRSWLDSAWNAVSAVGDWVADGLEAGKRRLLEEVRDFVQYIPGYKGLRVVLGEDPITGEFVERNGHNFIEAAFDIIPGGRLLHQKLTELGALAEAETWVDGRLEGVRKLVSGVLTSISNFISGISLSSLGDPRGLIDRGTRIIRNIISSVVTFAENAAAELLSIVKRFLLTQLVAFIRERTSAYPLLRVVLGKDPVTEEEVQRNGTNILNAMLELSEEGREQRKQMQETGTFQKVADWIDTGIAVFSTAYDQIVAGFHTVWGMVNIQSLLNPVQTFQRIYNIFSPPVSRVLRFMAQTALIILRLIKEALMSRLSAYARTVRGYSLLTVILGKDPFTNQQVPRSVENIIRGFMSLMEGGEEQFNQLQQSGAIQRTVARINAAVNRLNMTPAAIVLLFINLWNSLSLRDLANPIAAFRRIIATFGRPIARLIAFVVEIVKIVVEVVLQVMNFPSDLIRNIITKAMMAFEMIKRDPVGFLKNLLRAIKQGFIQFFRNIGTHLISGLQAWLMGELRDAGIRLPTDFTLRGILGWVLEILGISMERIWQKLAEHPRIGPERVARIRSMIDRLEGIWTFIRDVQQRGMAAIWERIQERLSNLWDTILDSIKNWIMQRVINQMVTRLLSMLDPTGIMAVINSAIALYRAVQSFIRYLRQMLEIVNSFVEGTVQIANGNITIAANFLERTLARGVPIVIGFLANQVGLSGLGRRIAEMLESVRGMVDRALTWLVDRAVTLGGRLLEMGRSAVARVVNWWQARKTFSAMGANHSLYFSGQNQNARLILASDPKEITTWLQERETSLRNTNNYSSEKSEAVNHIRTVIIPEINRFTSSPDPSTQRDINVVLTELSEKIRIIGVENSIPVPPMTVNPGFSNSRTDGEMTVRFLYDDPLNHQNGGPTTGRESIEGVFEEIQGLGLSAYWSRGHILNKDFGGPAVLSNLIPITQSVNLRQIAFDNRIRMVYQRKDSPIYIRFNIGRHSDDRRYISSYSAVAKAMRPQGQSWSDNGQEIADFNVSSIDKPGGGLSRSIKSLSSSSTVAQFREVGRSNNLSVTFLQSLISSGHRKDNPQDLKDFANSTFTGTRLQRYLNRIQSAETNNMLNFN